VMLRFGGAHRGDVEVVHILHVRPRGVR
jgi:hypothetical protein